MEGGEGMDDGGYAKIVDLEGGREMSVRTEHRKRSGVKRERGEEGGNRRKVYFVDMVRGHSVI